MNGQKAGLELATGQVFFSPIGLQDGDLAGALGALWGKGSGTLLGHAMDGVLWGRLLDGRIDLPVLHGLHGASLDRATLLDLSVFDDHRELRLWRAEGGLAGRWIQEDNPDPGRNAVAMTFCARGDRAFELLGGRVPASGDAGFALRRGRGGQEHAPPAVAKCLLVRSYFARDDETGLLREAAHRYLGVTEG